MQQTETKKKLRFTTKDLATVSMLCAMAVVLLYIEFPIFPVVAHLKLNVSDAPALIGTFMYGPVAGVVINAMKVGLCLLLRGTSTGYVGDLSNLVSGTLYVLVAGVIYLVKKDKLGAVIALITSSLVFCAAMWFCNQWFLLPLFGVTEHAAQMTMLWWTLLFNVIKTTLTGGITFFVYKPLSRFVRMGGKKKKRAADDKDGANGQNG